MTTVRILTRSDNCRVGVAGTLRWALLVCLACTTHALGQDGPVHWRHAGAMPPGAIGRQRLMKGGPLSGYCQPVEIRAPQGARIAPATGSSFGAEHIQRVLVGLQVGPVYRFRVTDIVGHPGVEVFPTVELIDRLYPPPDQATRFPVPIELTRSELLMAAEGSFVTRVIYVEDPQLALSAASEPNGDTGWIEARPGDDPLVTADALGRPIAILRMGGRVPDQNQPDNAFTYGAPPMMIYDQPATQPDGAYSPVAPYANGAMLDALDDVNGTILR